MEYCLQDFLDGRVGVYTHTRDQLIRVLSCIVDYGERIRGNMSIDQYLQDVGDYGYLRHVCKQTKVGQENYGYFLAFLDPQKADISYECFLRISDNVTEDPSPLDIDDLF